MKARLASFAPQFLVDDLDRSIAYYRKIGIRFGEPWEGFYGLFRTSGQRGGMTMSPRSTRSRKSS
jgi:hypothetical protein